MLADDRGGAPGRRSVRAAGLANLPRRARAPRDGIRNPILTTGRAGGDTAGFVRGASGSPIARGAQRGLANPWRLPALHFSPAGERKTGRATRALAKTGGEALVFALAPRGANAHISQSPRNAVRHTRRTSRQRTISGKSSTRHQAHLQRMRGEILRSRQGPDRLPDLRDGLRHSRSRRRRAAGAGYAPRSAYDPTAQVAGAWAR